MPCILSAWCTDTTVYGHYAFCKIKYKHGGQTDDWDYNFDAVGNSIHGQIIHTIRTEAIAVVVEQGGGVWTLQKFGVNRYQQANAITARKLKVCEHVTEASSFTLKTQLTEIISSKVWIQGSAFTLYYSFRKA